MESRWEAHNRHQSEGIEAFASHDPTLRRVSRQHLIYESGLLETLAAQPAGIYTLCGGRQVGKTTLLKQLMLRLLRSKGIAPKQLTYLPGESLIEGTEFRKVLGELASKRGDGLRYIFVDEISYIDGWNRALKDIADTGVLENVYLLLAGHDQGFLQDRLKQLPGGRGRAPRVDFHYYPLNFLEFCSLRGKVRPESLESLSAGQPEGVVPELAPIEFANLKNEFRRYHRTGGYLSAINDFERDDRVAAKTYRTYYELMRGDLASQRYHEVFLRGILDTIHSRYAEHVTWNALGKETSIDQVRTIMGYCSVLERMDVFIVLPALHDDRIAAAPKKARKIYFSDPFIYRAVGRYLTADLTQYEIDARPEPLRGERLFARLIEGSITSHVRRVAPTYYIKGEGDITTAYVRDNRVWPIDVTWKRRRILPKDLRKLRKYPDALVAGRLMEQYEVAGRVVLPAPVVLLRLSRLQTE